MWENDFDQNDHDQDDRAGGAKVHGVKTARIGAENGANWRGDIWR